MTDQRELGIALSGGGHRATVFGLGALLAVSDAGLNERTVSIASVSGGSIANGIVMSGPDYGTTGSAELERHLAPAIGAIAARGILLGGAPATKGYLRMLIGASVVAALALVVAVVAMIAHWWVILIVAAAVALVAGALAWRLFGQRSIRTERAIDQELLRGEQGTLAQQQARSTSVHHVICTTELQTGTSFYFTNRAVYGHGFGGNTAPTDVPLATAVQASACVPGAFAPRVIPLRDLGLPVDGAERIVVSDGGVYDNMADEWEYGYANRRRNWKAVAEVQPDGARTLLVVNASAGWNDVKPIRGGRIGLELAGLLRSKDVQYDVSTAHRRRALAARFIDNDDRESGRRGLTDGVFVQITSSPYDAPSRFGPKPGFEPDAFSTRALEARRYLDELGYTPDGWEEAAKASSGVPTTLAKLGPEMTARLLEHGYVLTVVNLYVILGLGRLDPTLDRRRFDRLARGQVASAPPG